MKNMIYIFLFMFLFTQYVNYSQNNESSVNNAIFLELGGNGLFSSINYEHFFPHKIGIRFGMGSLIVQGISYPIMINKYFGDEKKLELGIGIVPFSHLEKKSYWGSDKNGILISTTIGHQSSKSGGGLLLRYSFTPAYNINDNKYILYLGLSIGISL